MYARLLIKLPDNREDILLPENATEFNLDNIQLSRGCLEQDKVPVYVSLKKIMEHIEKEIKEALYEKIKTIKLMTEIDNREIVFFIRNTIDIMDR